ncbi:hypothetical protein CDV31_015224, partial [Fusarium ambrosium]
RVPAKRSSITLPIITGRQQTGKLDPCSAPRNPSPPSRQAPGFPSGADDSPPPFWLVLHHHFGAATEVVVDKVGPLTRTRFAIAPEARFDGPPANSTASPHPTLFSRTVRPLLSESPGRL